MGGNALKTLKGKGRMSPQEYQRVKEEALKQLGKLYEKVCVPLEAFGKLDHGDVDMVCLLRDPDQNAGTPIDHILFIKQELGSTEVVHNAHLIFFEFMGRQIDLVQVRTQEALDFKLVFDSYGVVGTALALMCKSLGLLINSERLAVSLTHQHTHPLLLTNNIWQVLRFLGLSGDVWKRGFLDRASLCHWFASSRFFNPQDFQVHPKCVRHQAVSVKEVLDILGCLPTPAVSDNETDKIKGIGPIVDNCPAIKTMQGCMLDGMHSVDPSFDMQSTPRPSQEDVLVEALRFFNKEHEYQALLSMQYQCQQLKLKFNGGLVMQWTGCSKKDLGCLIPAFKARFSASDILDEGTIKQELLSLMQSLSVAPG